MTQEEENLIIQMEAVLHDPRLLAQKHLALQIALEHGKVIIQETIDGVLIINPITGKPL